MKKIVLFGFGILLTGSVFAGIITAPSGGPVVQKSTGETVSHEEFNLLSSVANLFIGMVYDASGNLNFPNFFEAAKLTAPEICIGGNCITAWTGGADNMGNHEVTQNIIPDTNNAYDLGSDTVRFQDIFTKTLKADTQICINADCRTSWPTGGGGVTALACASGEQLQTVAADGTFTCGVDDAGGAGVTALICAPGEQLQTVAVDGTFTCGADATGGGGVTALTCPSGQQLQTVAADGTFTCGTDQSSGTSQIDTLLSSNWCWSPDGIEIDCDREAPGGSVPCIDYQYHKCISDKLWWFDSCDAPMGIVKEDCTALGGCTANEIGGTCANAGGGGSSLWTTIAGGINYDAGNVGVKTANPLTEFDVGGTILAKEFCINTDLEADACATKACTSTFASGTGGSTCFTQQTLADLEAALDNGDDDWLVPTFSSVPNSIYLGFAGNVGIGTTNPLKKLHVIGSGIAIEMDGGAGGDLIVAGTVQVGGHTCPAPWATCANAGEIASCGAGGAILACAGASSQWMPITSHNGTVVGTNTYTCDASKKGIMRFYESGLPTSEKLQICMKELNSNTYAWRSIMIGGGNAF